MQLSQKLFFSSENKENNALNYLLLQQIILKIANFKTNATFPGFRSIFADIDMGKYIHSYLADIVQ